MERKTIKNILNFLKEKEGKEVPNKWELIHKLENHPDGTQYRHESGGLYLKGSNITKLPNDLYATNYLDLTDCKQLTELPTKLHVEGGLHLMNCQQLTKLPDNLYVGSFLDLEYSGIKSLPKGLKVGDDLFISNTELTKYTNNELRKMIKPGFITGRIER